MSASTFENIGARAGYSRGLASRHFGSKSGLIRALVERLQERREEAMAVGEKAPQGLDGVIAFVDGHMEALVRDAELRAYFITLASTVAERSDLRILFAEAHEAVAQRLEELVLAGKSAGTVRTDVDANAVALMIGSLLFGLSMQLLLDPTFDLSPVRQVILTTINRGLAPTTPAIP